jgi:hypothetical protein
VLEIALRAVRRGSVITARYPCPTPNLGIPSLAASTILSLPNDHVSARWRSFCRANTLTGAMSALDKAPPGSGVVAKSIPPNQTYVLDMRNLP